MVIISIKKEEIGVPSVKIELEIRVHGAIRGEDAVQDLLEKDDLDPEAPEERDPLAIEPPVLTCVPHHLKGDAEVDQDLQGDTVEAEHGPEVLYTDAAGDLDLDLLVILLLENMKDVDQERKELESGSHMQPLHQANPPGFHQNLMLMHLSQMPQSLI